MADETIVVMNPAPMNAGNSREGKTQGTLTVLWATASGQKPDVDAKGLKENKRELKQDETLRWEENDSLQCERVRPNWL